MKVVAKKSLGQHFLADLNICRRIVQFAAIEPDDRVVEIGPGEGQLTHLLLEFVDRLIAVEIDDDLVDRLRNTDAARQGRLEVRHDDVLKVDWNEIPNPPLKIVGNLPYNIATRIIQQMIPFKNRFQSLTVMVQKEVARRVLARGGKDYGYLSALLGFHFAPLGGFDVPPGAFRPPPEVTSSVLKLVPIQDGRDREAEKFESLIGQAFRQRRKTLFNNLKHRYGPGTTREALDACGLDVRVRPQEVDTDGLRCLARVL